MGTLDTSNAARQRQYRLRKALKAQLAAGDLPSSTSAPATPAEVEENRRIMRYAQGRELAHLSSVARFAMTERLISRLDAVVAKLGDMAEGGDIAAIIRVVDTFLPRAKTGGRHVALDLPSPDSLANLSIAQRIVTEATGRGELSLDDAAHLGAMLEKTQATLESAKRHEIVHRIRNVAGADAALAARIDLLTSRASIVLDQARRLDAPTAREPVKINGHTVVDMTADEALELFR